jgi:hypothetical protein
MAIQNKCHMRHKPYTKMSIQKGGLSEFDTHTIKCEEPQL